MLGIAFALGKSFRFNCLLIATAYVGVGLTYGRSGFIVLTLMSGFYILANARRHLNFLILGAAIAIPLIGVGVAVLQSQTQRGILQNKDTTDRLEAILNLDLDKLKSPERAKDLADAMEAVLKKPFLGHGTGVSGALWAPHNEYVSLWLELGIPGLVLFIGTLGILCLRSLMMGGRAGYLLFAMIAYTPAGQGRIEAPHFLLAISTAAFAALRTDLVVSLTTAQVAAFGSVNVRALTSVQLAALEADDLQALTTFGVNSMSA
jgi:O-antigen ligase